VCALLQADTHLYGQIWNLDDLRGDLEQMHDKHEETRRAPYLSCRDRGWDRAGQSPMSRRSASEGDVHSARPHDWSFGEMLDNLLHPIRYRSARSARSGGSSPKGPRSPTTRFDARSLEGCEEDADAGEAGDVLGSMATDNGSDSSPATTVRRMSKASRFAHA